MTETKEPYNAEKSPFDELFRRRPWLVPLLMMIRRQLGIVSEFIEVHAKPYTRKK
ncbi:MAG: hypothetical protein ACYSWP_12090 [Planctomycetota bacterium]|jgi:hypothetical protein